MSNQERQAREYCRLIGADPDENISYFQREGPGVMAHYVYPRWRMYGGASHEFRQA